MAIAFVTAANIGVPNGVAPLNASGAVPVSMGGTGVTSFPAGALTSDGTTVSGGVLAVSMGGTGVTTSTGTGNLVLSSSPILINPNLGTPSNLSLTNATGLPLTSGTVGILPLTKGGTGSASAQAALNVLVGSVTSGTFLRGNGTNMLASGIQVSDVPTLNQDTTGTSASVTSPSQPAITSVGTLTSLTVSGVCSLSGGMLLSGVPGTSGQVLTSAGAGMPPSWTTVASGGGGTELPKVQKPTNIDPPDGTTIPSGATYFSGSPYRSLYGAELSTIQFQFSRFLDFSLIAYDTGEFSDTGVARTIDLSALPTGQSYYWRVRYKSIDADVSEWSNPTAFILEALSIFMPVPAATPAFGAAFEGGFYGGMIWNELVSSTTSLSISTGPKILTVPFMNDTPIVYSGQVLEIRSKANPNNKMVGTVSAAIGTDLTINVTSVGGSGTFTDWSVMAQYRIIVAPKASGESADIRFKNANTALPVACQTLTEGWRSTQAMRLADTSTVYPAAHWARNLTIGGFTDWYIPARDELELCWRNLKPVTDLNTVVVDRSNSPTVDYQNNGSYKDAVAAAGPQGLNNNSSPAGAAYTTTVPGQTGATAFRTGGTEAFTFSSTYYWTSSEYSATSVFIQMWSYANPGSQNITIKMNMFWLRAVRRSII